MTKLSIPIKSLLSLVASHRRDRLSDLGAFFFMSLCIIQEFHFATRVKIIYCYAAISETREQLLLVTRWIDDATRGWCRSKLFPLHKLRAAIKTTSICLHLWPHHHHYSVKQTAASCHEDSRVTCLFALSIIKPLFFHLSTSGHRMAY